MSYPVASTVSKPANNPCEDGHVIVRHAAPESSLFAIIDGHEGEGVKNLIQAELPTLFSKCALKGVEALKDLTASLEASALSDKAVAGSGACLAMLLYSPSAANPLAVSSVGDSAVIVACKDSEDVLHPLRASGLSHNYSNGAVLGDALSNGAASSEFEFEDLEGAHPAGPPGVSRNIPNGEVDEKEAMIQYTTVQFSRSIGDAWAKRPTTKPPKPAGAKRSRAKSQSAGGGVVTAEPYTFEEAKDAAFAVLCTDGITDNVSDDMIVAIVAEHYRRAVAAGGDMEARARAAAEELVAKSEQRSAFDNEISAAALRAMPAGDLPDGGRGRRKYADDMTAMVVFFPPPAGAPLISELSV